MQTDRNPRHSGYAATIDDWRRFLSCWYHEDREVNEWDADGSLVKRDVLMESPLSSTDAIRKEIDGHEARLGLALPQSYVDFLVAYCPTQREFRDRDFAHISIVDTIESVNPEFVHSLREAAHNAPDSEYFAYGTDLRDETRTRYADTSIVIGMHDSSPLYSIVLHPEVLTSDGEMESEIFFHAGSWRAPSFAEMMRFLYFYTVRSPPGSPAVSQEMMRGTCADLLPMKGVWWK